MGEILEVTFPRPRERKAVLEHPDYYRLREHLITFLEERSHIKKGRSVPPAANPLPPSAPINSHPKDSSVDRLVFAGLIQSN